MSYSKESNVLWLLLSTFEATSAQFKTRVHESGHCGSGQFSFVVFAKKVSGLVAGTTPDKSGFGSAAVEIGSNHKPRCYMRQEGVSNGDSSRFLVITKSQLETFLPIEERRRDFTHFAFYHKLPTCDVSSHSAHFVGSFIKIKQVIKSNPSCFQWTKSVGKKCQTQKCFCLLETRRYLGYKLSRSSVSQLVCCCPRKRT